VLKVKIKTLAQPWDFVLAEIAWKDILIAVPANTYLQGLDNENQLVK